MVGTTTEEFQSVVEFVVWYYVMGQKLDCLKVDILTYAVVSIGVRQMATAGITYAFPLRDQDALYEEDNYGMNLMRDLICLHIVSHMKLRRYRIHVFFFLRVLWIAIRLTLFYRFEKLINQ